MGKLLFWVVVIAVIWLAFSLIRVSQRKQELAEAEARANEGRPKRPAGGRAKGGPARLEEMISCAHCGVFLPTSDSLLGKGGRYCCVEHRDAARR